MDERSRVAPRVADSGGMGLSMKEQTRLIGRVLGGRYKLLAPLGRGAFGHTFLALDQPSGRTVAVKLLDPRGAADWKAFELFEREASVLRSLRHQAIPEVFEWLREESGDGSALFLVMEYVEGPSIEQLIDERKPLQPQDTLQLFLEMLSVLEYLHGRSPPVLHRDIKPSNIIVRPNGLPSLVDFGSVRSVLAHDDAGSTVAGTYGYMPYEQYMGQATPASDLYALAATFLHLLTGRPPRDFMNAEGRIEAPPSLPGDPRLGPVIVRLLKTSPADRFPSAQAARNALLAPTSVVPHGTPGAAAGKTLLARPLKVATNPVMALPAPRKLKGPTKKLLKELSPSMWDYMEGSKKKQDSAGVIDLLSFVFFSTLTVGTLPILFYGVARSRRRRLKPFLRIGIPGVAQIVNIRLENLGFGANIAQVSYEFEADGMLHRDVDQVLPVVSDRWRPGDTVEILYLPRDDYDSVIVSSS
jgi:serine/threonine protein kinase